MVRVFIDLCELCCLWSNKYTVTFELYSNEHKYFSQLPVRLPWAQQSVEVKEWNFNTHRNALYITVWFSHCLCMRVLSKGQLSYLYATMVQRALEFVNRNSSY